MKRTGHPNINDRGYWDMIYGDDHKRKTYATQGTDLSKADGEFIKPTARFQKALDEVKSGDKVLDIGCGVGVFTTLVKNTYPECEVWGTDISKAAIDANRLNRPDISYFVRTVGDQNVPDDYFDYVFSGEVLEHLDHPEDLFKDVYKALRPGGKFCLSTPETNHIQSEEHVWEFSHEDIENLYFSNGFNIVRFIYLPNLEHLSVIMAVGEKK